MRRYAVFAREFLDRSCPNRFVGILAHGMSDRKYDLMPQIYQCLQSPVTPCLIPEKHYAHIVPFHSSPLPNTPIYEPD
ncbi:Uncharacterised protein [Mycobacteroides abscessus]|nr:Uncharacterised protein [Mycobacteroides abscessus]